MENEVMSLSNELLFDLSMKSKYLPSKKIRWMSALDEMNDESVHQVSVFPLQIIQRQYDIREDREMDTEVLLTLVTEERLLWQTLNDASAVSSHHHVSFLISFQSSFLRSMKVMVCARGLRYSVNHSSLIIIFHFIFVTLWTRWFSMTMSLIDRRSIIITITLRPSEYRITIILNSVFVSP